MSQPRNHPHPHAHARPRPGGPSISTTSPLLSSSTITFLASWRGQLLICTVVLILGGVYFVLQEPMAQYRRRRREALSRARGEELMSMEDKDKDKDRAKTAAEKEVEEPALKDKRGREKKKDVKKRKASLLRVPVVSGSGESGASSAGISSIEGSPVPGRMSHSTPPRPLASPSKARIRDLPASGEKSSAPRVEVGSSISANGDTSPRRTLEPSLLPAMETTPKPSRLQPPSSLSPWDVPLPASPLAGPSRSPLLSSTDIESADGDHGDTSESAQSSHLHGEGEVALLSNGTKPKPIEFSIIPEEGYLPITQPISSKKKKRKNRAPPPAPLPSLERRASVSADSGANGGVPDSPAVPVTPSRQARKASLTRPPNADLEELLTEREQMIEGLRAENGLAKAEEAKAKDELSRARAAEERLKGDVERARKGGQRMETDGRKRESELTARLNHLTSLYAGAVQRIGTLEALFRDQQGNSSLLPPPSPGMMHPGNSPSLIPVQHLQPMPMPSPLPPASPFGMGVPMGYAPSPRAVSGGGFISYPSPGMFPSPMLHPNFHSHSHPHSHSPSPFRRASTSGPADELAGPLTPGHPTPPPGSGQFPFDLGIMPSPTPAGAHATPNGPPTPADLRRMSIESSVLKKKVQQPRSDRSESGEESNRGSDPLPDIDEAGSVQGLGMGDVGGSGSIEASAMNHGHGENGAPEGGPRAGAADDAESVRSSSHQSSPSPPNRRSMLLTPAPADVFHRALVQGTDTPDAFDHQQREGLTGMNDIKVIADAERGNLYYREIGERECDRSSFSSDSARADGHDGHANGANGLNGHANGHGDAHVSLNDEADAGRQGGGEREEDVPEEEDYVPMFASLAHTPQQIAEIQRMREGAIKAKQRDVAARGPATPGV